MTTRHPGRGHPRSTARRHGWAARIGSAAEIERRQLLIVAGREPRPTKAESIPLYQQSSHVDRTPLGPRCEQSAKGEDGYRGAFLAAAVLTLGGLLAARMSGARAVART